MGLGSAATDQIRQWGKSLSRNISIRFRTSSDERSRELDQFLLEFADCAEKVRIIPEQAEAGELPAILVSPNLTYQALPHDRELAPFLFMLSHTLGEIEPLDATSMDRLGQVVWPAEIRVFIAAACPHCPEIVKKLAPLAFHQPLIQMNIIDGVLFPELSEPHGVRSVPTVLLDGQFRWTGSLDRTEFLETLVHRDAALLPASSLKNLLKEGHADQLSAMILERGEVLPAFADLVTHPEWSVRLGALVVAEEILEKDPTLAQNLLPPLWERFGNTDVTVKGDIVYLIGLAGSEEWAPRLRNLLTTDLPDELREAVQEALAKW
jgi:glutaredoxin